MTGEGFSQSVKHTYNNKNILTTQAKWQLNEIKLQVFKRSRGRSSEASENKTSFSRIMKLAGQTLLVDCSYNSVEVSPPMSIHNLSHLKCTMVGEEMHKPEKGVCQGACKTQAAVP